MYRGGKIILDYFDIAEEIVSWKTLRDRAESAHYTAVHKEMYTLFGQPQICMSCGSISDRKYEWAHIHNTPMAASLESFVRMCVPCHRTYDKTEEGNSKISATLKAKGIVPPSRKGATMPEDARARISEAKKGIKPNNYGHRVLSDEQITDIQQRFSPSTRGRYGGNVKELSAEFSVSGLTIREIGNKIGRYSE